MMWRKLCLGHSEDSVSLCHSPGTEVRQVGREYPLPRNQPGEEESWVREGRHCVLERKGEAGGLCPFGVQCVYNKDK